MINRLIGCRIVSVEYDTRHISTGLILSPLTGRPLSLLPVVYVFGPNAKNEQLCLSVYGWFPYFYVDWPEALNTLFDSDVVRACGGLYWSVPDSRCQRAVQYDSKNEVLSSAPRPPFVSSKDLVYALFCFLNAVLEPLLGSQVIYTIEIVLRRSIYGYNRERIPFFKIYLLNIDYVSLAAQCLYKGEFYGIVFQPYNVHVVGHQFMTDHNLFGMGILWVEERHLEKNENANIVADKSYQIKACHIWNQYTVRQIEPDTQQDRMSLMKAQNTMSDPFLCSSDFVFSTLPSYSASSLWKDTYVDDFSKPDAPPLVNSLKEFWDEEIERRRYLKRCPPESLRSLCELKDLRLVQTVTQVLEEDSREILETICPSFSASDYTFYASRKELLLHSLRFSTATESSLEKTSAMCVAPIMPFFSNPNDMSFKVFKGFCFKKVLVHPYSTIRSNCFAFLQSYREEDDQVLTYSVPIPFSDKTCTTKSALSFTNEDAVLRKNFSCESSAELRPTVSPPESLDQTSYCVFETSSDAFPTVHSSVPYISPSEAVECCLRPSYSNLSRSLSCKYKSLQKKSSTPMLDLLKRRHRERQLRCPYGISHKNKTALPDISCGRFWPQFGRMLGIHIITDTKLNEHCSNAYHVAGNPRTDAMLGIVYLLRQERGLPCLEGSLDLEYSETFTDTLGVVQVVNENYQLQQFVQHEIPVSRECYSSLSFQQRDPFLCKGIQCLDVSVHRSYVPSEIDLVYWILHNLFRDFDPLFILGFNIHTESIGYLFRRAKFLGLKNVELHFGRLIPDYPLQVFSVNQNAGGSRTRQRYQRKGIKPSAASKLSGRVVLNLWRLLRASQKSIHDTLHEYAQAVLRITFPMYPIESLTEWWHCTTRDGRPYVLREFVLRYCIRCLQLCFKLFTASHLFSRYVEQSGFLGIDLYSTIVRGSQYYVEGILVRAANTLGYVLLTATKSQTTRNPALLTIPLVLEPESKFYADPVIVLDFQSLYPSIMIAYNICFSTCLGRLKHLFSETQHNGFSKNHKIPLGVLSQACITCLSDVLEYDKTRVNVFIAPNQVLYVSPEIRRGILPELMERVISMRLAIKRSCDFLDEHFSCCSLLDTKKTEKSSEEHLYVNRNTPKILESRQLALKLFANCTYGYTSASFSGRMLCGEVAESIVQIGRRTLDRAMTFVESHPRWNASIVYGDTDSLFALVKSRGLAEAFKIGQEITEAVTRLNPWPVELRMEKVYYPCFLLTKKRYVGWKYTSATGSPTLDSKGIETIRRDQCPLVSTCLSRVLIILFKTFDLSQVKKYLMELWSRMHLLEPYFSFNNFMFYRKIKLGSYVCSYNGKLYTLPPQAVVAYKLYSRWNYRHCDDDPPESFFESGRRVPYVVVNSHPNSRLVDIVAPPFDAALAGNMFFSPLCPTQPNIRDKWIQKKMNGPSMAINVQWYITHQIIPTINRYFYLIHNHLRVQDWYSYFPRLQLDDHDINLNLTLRLFKEISSTHLNHFVADYPSFIGKHEISSGQFGQEQTLQRSTKPDTGNIAQQSSNFSTQFVSFQSLIGRKIKWIPYLKITHLLKKADQPQFCRLCHGRLDIESPFLSSVEQKKRQYKNPFCAKCRQAPGLHIWKLYSSWNVAEELFSKYMALCINCTGSRFAAESCHNAFHCSIYTARSNLRQRLYKAVIDIEDLLT